MGYSTRDVAYDSSSELHQRLYGRSHRHQGNVFYVLVCKAALGYPVRTQKYGRSSCSMDTGKPVFPQLSGIPGVSPPMLHHSLIAELGGDLNRYREFILFNSMYVQPQYLVAYHRYKGNARI